MELQAAALDDVQKCRPIYRAYTVFCRLNDLRISDENTVFWVAQMEASLGVRTMRLYIKRLKKYLRYLQDPGAFVVDGLVHVCSKMSTTAPRRHAMDISEECVTTMMMFLQTSNPRVFLCAYMMCYTGLRFVDLQHLQKSGIYLDSKGVLYVDVRRSKTIKSDWMRQELAIPATLGLDNKRPLHAFFLAELQKIAEEDTVVPTGATCGEFNEYLSGAYPEQGRQPTSYSLRRFAFDRFIEANRNRKGIVDWKKACRLSLHLNEATLKAFYYKGARAALSGVE